MRETASLSALVLGQALRQPSPERDQRAENPAAVFVAIAFQNAQHVFAGEQPAKGQPVVSGELVADDSEVFARHRQTFPHWGGLC